LVRLMWPASSAHGQVGVRVTEEVCGSSDGMVWARTF
jgi:hypothetical protein